MKKAAMVDREALARFCIRWCIREMSIFGSALRDDFGPESDIDFLLSFKPGAGWDLWDLVALREDLMDIVGREVDIVVKEAIRNPYRHRAMVAHREVIHAV